MGAKIAIIVAAVGGFLALLWIMSQTSTAKAVASAAVPQLTSLPVNSISPLASLTPLLAPGSPSTVSPAVPAAIQPTSNGGAITVAATTAPVTGAAAAGPAYLYSGDTITDNSLGTLPLPTGSPSLVSLQTTQNTSVLSASASGVDDPGIQQYMSDTDNSDYDD